MPPPSLVVFDLDGTLVDTAPDLAATMNRLLSSLGRRELDPGSVRMMVGRGARVLMEQALVASGPPPSQAELDRLVAEFLVLYEAHIADLSVPFAGIETALDGLDRRGIVSAVCTNKPERLSGLLLDALNLGERFRAVVGGDTLNVSKPHPEPLFAAIERAGATPDRAVMVGDSITDIKTARAAGVPFVGISFGYTETPMAELGPDILINGFDELEGALDRL